MHSDSLQSQMNLYFVSMCLEYIHISSSDEIDSRLCWPEIIISLCDHLDHNIHLTYTWTTLLKSTFFIVISDE